MLRFNPSPENSLRMKGAIFDGFTNPVTGFTHQRRRISKRERSLILSMLAKNYLKQFGHDVTGPLLGSPGVLEVFPQILASAPEALTKRLAEAEASADSEPSIVDRYKRVALCRKDQKLCRVVVAAEADRENIPKEYWDRFVFWFVGSQSPMEHIPYIESSFDGILNLTAWEAHNSAVPETPETVRSEFERILDRAIADAELVLEPVVSLAPTADLRLVFKLIVYLLLIREGAKPDPYLRGIELNTIADKSYFCDDSCTRFKDEQGFLRCILEGLTIQNEIMWRERSHASFAELQYLLSFIQYTEDASILAFTATAGFDRLFSVT